MILLVLLGATPWEKVLEHRVHEAGSLRSLELPQRAALQSLAQDLAAAAPSGAVPQGLQERASAAGCVLVVEPGLATLATRGGHGVLAVRLGAAVNLVLQAPHPWYDLGTGSLTEALFLEGNARAVVFSTTHRHLAPNSDAAHEAEGGFQALTLGVVAGLEAPTVVQIHGFGKGHTEADLVVGGWGARVLGEQLQQLGWVVTDGVGVPSLAGKKNVQVRALTGRVPVAHLEFSKRAREALERPEARSTLTWFLERWAR